MESLETGKPLSFLKRSNFYQTDNELGFHRFIEQLGPTKRAL